jgi:hypothetical protein
MSRGFVASSIHRQPAAVGACRLVPIPDSIGPRSGETVARLGGAVTLPAYRGRGLYTGAMAARCRIARATEPRLPHPRSPGHLRPDPRAARLCTRHLGTLRSPPHRRRRRPAAPAADQRHRTVRGAPWNAAGPKVKPRRRPPHKRRDATSGARPRPPARLGAQRRSAGAERRARTTADEARGECIRHVGAPGPPGRRARAALGGVSPEVHETGRLG